MTEEATETTTPERRVVKPAELRLLLYRLTLDWIGLRQSLPVPSGIGVGRTSNVRTYGHPAEWASDQCNQIASLFWWWHQELAEIRGETPPKSWTPAYASHRPIRFAKHQHLIPTECRRTLMRCGHRFETPKSPAAVSRQREIVVDAWRYLEPRIEQLIEITDPDTEPFQQAFDVHGQIRARLGLSQKQTTLPIPCPNEECNLLTLQRIAGMNRDYVICGACSYYIDAEYYPLLVRMALDTLTNDGE